MSSLQEQILSCESGMREMEVKRRGLIRSLRRKQAIDQDAAEVLKRFESGQYIVCPFGRFYWCENGTLLDRVGTEDREAVFRLKELGIISKELH